MSYVVDTLLFFSECTLNVQMKNICFILSLSNIKKNTKKGDKSSLTGQSEI